MLYDVSVRLSVRLSVTEVKGVDLTGLLGDIKDWGFGGAEVPQKLKLFYETTHNICIKIQQRTVVGYWIK